MAGILDKLRGGDLRSIGHANEVADDIIKKPALFKKVFVGLFDTDPVVRMRSADVIEKVSRRLPELLSEYKPQIISILSNPHEQQEVCWHMAQIAPRLKYSKSERDEVAKALKKYMEHKSKIVRVNAMESLTVFAENNSSLEKEVRMILKTQIKYGSPAVQSRGRKLLNRLKDMQI